MAYIGVKHKIKTGEDYSTKYPTRTLSEPFKKQYNNAVADSTIVDFDKKNKDIMPTPEIFKVMNTDLLLIEKKVRLLVGFNTDIEQKHFDALISIVWSGGDISSVVSYIQDGDFESASREIYSIPGNGQRREQEYNLFKSGRYSMNGEQNKEFYKYYYESRYYGKPTKTGSQGFKQSILQSDVDSFNKIKATWLKNFTLPGVPRVGYSTQEIPSVVNTPPPGPGFGNKDSGGGGWYGASRTSNPTGIHKGIDILATPGADVKAPVDGVFGYVARLSGSSYRGHQVSIICDDDPTFYTRLMYFQPSDFVKKGKPVKRGDVIGTCVDIRKYYNTGNSMPNHIHAELRKTDPKQDTGMVGESINLMGLYFNKDDVV